uniref:Novel STAND NTPase 1 domain-containing protein n=1 Tax=Streptomyces sp. NBC_00049 TaxID=2903617 RepID=A0AAU2JKU3_9ACTN
MASFRPGYSPYDSVARALLDLESPDADHTLERLERRARALREEGFWPVATRIALLTGRRLALVGDQFEEVLSNGGPALRQEFLERMLPEPDTMGDSPVRLVCTLRSDFLPDLLDLPARGWSCPSRWRRSCRRPCTRTNSVCSRSCGACWPTP